MTNVVNMRGEEVPNEILDNLTVSELVSAISGAVKILEHRNLHEIHSSKIMVGDEKKSADQSLKDSWAKIMRLRGKLRDVGGGL